MSQLVDLCKWLFENHFLDLKITEVPPSAKEAEVNVLIEQTSNEIRRLNHLKAHDNIDEKALSRCIQKKEFLEFLKLNSEDNLLFLTLNFLLKDKVQSQTSLLKARNILSILLNSPLMSVNASNEIGIASLAITANQFFNQLKQDCAGQTNPLGFISLAYDFIDVPEKMAGFILWLLEQGVTADDILKSQLLQDLYLQYYAYLSDPDNPIDLLYKILSLYPMADELCNKASKTSASTEDKLIMRPEKPLNGDEKQEELAILQTKVPELEINIEQIELNKLHAIFGNRLIWGLPKILEQLDDLRFNRIIKNTEYDEKASKIRDFLEEQFANLNKGSLSLDELSQHICLLYKENNTKQLQEIACCIDDKIIDFFIKENELSIVFLEEKAKKQYHLKNKITSENIKAYCLKLLAIDGEDRSNGILTIFKLLEYPGNEELLLETAFNLLLRDQRLQHQALIQEKFNDISGYTYTWGESKASALKMRLETEIKNHLSNSQGLTKEIIHQAEDLWSSLLTAYTILKLFNPRLTKFPDKYDVYVFIFLSARERFGVWESLMSFVTLAQEDESRLIEIQRALIEIMLKAGRYEIDMEIINLLESPPFSDKLWYTKPYGNSVFINRLFAEDNVDLLQLIFRRYPLSHANIKHWLIQAAETNKHKIVEVIMLSLNKQASLSNLPRELEQKNKVSYKINLLNEVLWKAFDKGHFETVAYALKTINQLDSQFLVDLAKESLKKSVKRRGLFSPIDETGWELNNLFSTAASCGYFSIVEFVISANLPLRPRTILNFIEQALLHKDFELMGKILQISTESLPLVDELPKLTEIIKNLLKNEQHGILAQIASSNWGKILTSEQITGLLDTAILVQNEALIRATLSQKGENRPNIDNLKTALIHALSGNWLYAKIIESYIPPAEDIAFADDVLRYFGKSLFFSNGIPSENCFNKAFCDAFRYTRYYEKLSRAYWAPENSTEFKELSMQDHICYAIVTDSPSNVKLAYLEKAKNSDFPYCGSYKIVLDRIIEKINLPIELDLEVSSSPDLNSKLQALTQSLKTGTDVKVHMDAVLKFHINQGQSIGFFDETKQTIADRFIDELCFLDSGYLRKINQSLELNLGENISRKQLKTALHQYKDTILKENKFSP